MECYCTSKMDEYGFSFYITTLSTAWLLGINSFFCFVSLSHVLITFAVFPCPHGHQFCVMGMTQYFALYTKIILNKHNPTQFVLLISGLRDSHFNALCIQYNQRWCYALHSYNKMCLDITLQFSSSLFHFIMPQVSCNTWAIGRFPLNFSWVSLTSVQLIQSQISRKQEGNITTNSTATSAIYETDLKRCVDDVAQHSCQGYELSVCCHTHQRMPIIVASGPHAWTPLVYYHSLRTGPHL